MDDKRNIIIALKNYIESLGVVVNIGKTKARGNKGFFLNRGVGSYRIDISKNIDDNATLSTLLHEYAHYIHYKYDSSLKTLDFIFNDFSGDIKEELINVTVQNVPKEFAKTLFNMKSEVAKEINMLFDKISQQYPDVKKTTGFKPLEKGIKLPAKYLLKYDCIKYLGKIYTVQNVEHDFEYLSNEQIYYIKMKSLQRKQARINTKIRKLNNYYNQPSELWARFFELFFVDNKCSNELAPKATQVLKNLVNNCKYSEISELKKFFKI